MLVIDDEYVDREVVKRNLARNLRSITILEAESIAAGTVIASNLRIDLALLDLQLGNTRGLETVRLYMRELSTVPVIVLSGTADESLAMESIRLGAEDFIGKDTIQDRWLRIRFLNAIHRSELKRKLQMQTDDLEQYAYVVSHDLQEPLRAMSGYGQMLKARSSIRLDDKDQRYIGQIIAGSQRLQQLVDDLLWYAQTGSEQEPMAEVDLNRCMVDAQRNLETAISESAAIVVADDLPVIVGIATQLTQLFQNLIGNAIKYRGELTPEVKISSAVKGNTVEIAVADNGIGIPPDYQQQIFGLFKRLHHREEYTGTGIGLAICQKIVTRHRGSIQIESEVGAGSTFRVFLPQRQTANLAESL